MTNVNSAVVAMVRESVWTRMARSDKAVNEKLYGCDVENSGKWYRDPLKRKFQSESNVVCG